MQQIISLLLSLLTVFMNVLSVFFGNMGTTVTPKTGDYTWPLKSESVITAGYPSYSDGTPHSGIDITLKNGNSAGEPFYAAASGTVAEVSNDGSYNTGYGNYCLITHENNSQTLYAHASSITVTKGQTVSQGAQIGTIGSTGNASGPHLHFEIKTKNSDGTYTAVNPLNYISNPYDSSVSNPTPTPTPKPDPDPVTGKPSGTFTFTVYGFGHGVGMSQEGAIAMAKSGNSFDQIITHYFPGVTVEKDYSTPKNVTRNGNSITLVEFLCKTVAQEIGAGSPIEAIKAQAVASYTYAIYNNNFSSGQSYKSNFSYSGTNVEKAVFAVLNITSEDQQPTAYCAKYGGKYANTVYFASCPGKTTASQYVWVSAVPYLCGGVSSPETVSVSTKDYTAEEMKTLIKKYADSKGINVTLGDDPATWLNIVSHDMAYNSGIGYVVEIKVGGYSMKGNDFRERVLGNGIRSHCFTITYTP